MEKHAVGDLVFINLSKQQIQRKHCPQEVIAKFLGGRGLGDYLLLKYLPKTVQPLDAENMLIFAAGLLTGSAMITSGRLHVSGRSPLTGFLGSSNGGGLFAAELKACGILALIISGRSEKPLYISIEGQRIFLKDARMLWGLKTSETVTKLEAMTCGAKTVVIGPASENLTNLGGVMTGDGHFAGRSGMGTVMGSKNLKAIAVQKDSRQARKITPEEQELRKTYIQKLKKNDDWQTWIRTGSSSFVTWTDSLGAAATKNFNDVTFSGVATACGSSFEDAVVKYKACYNCPIHCKAEVKINRGRHKGFVGERPEYEMLSSWGPRCGNADGLESIYLANLCNDYGIDSLETANLVAFAMDLYEKGILTPKETGGLELTWGNVQAMEEMIPQIVCRSSWLGDALSQGIKRAAEIIGRGALKYGYHVKGMTLSIMDPRGFKACGLGYAVSSRGADYTSIYAKQEYSYTPSRALREYGTEKAADRLTEEGKPAVVRASMCANAVIDSLGVCKIPELSIMQDFNLELITEAVNAIAGLKLDTKELSKAGERIVNAERLFNFRFGATGADDYLPEKFLKEPIASGPSRGSVVKLQPMLEEFYHLMGWNADGSVGQDKITGLEITDLLETEEFHWEDDSDDKEY